MYLEASSRIKCVAIFNTMTSTPLSPQYLFTSVALKCIFFFLGTVGNVVVFIYHAFVNRDKDPGSYFVANLAFADVIVCLTVYPIGIADSVLYLLGVESLPETLCTLGYISSALSVALSSLTLLAVTYDRCIFIVQPLHYFSMMTWKKTYTILACVWILSLATIPVSLLTEALKKRTGVCENAPWGEFWMVIAFADVPLVFIVFLNMKIFKAAREQNKRIDRDCSPQANTFGRQNIKKIKALKTFACIVGVLLCYVPFSILIFVEHLICNTCIRFIARSLIIKLIGINSIVNPYIYALRHRQHRKEYSRILVMLFTCHFTG